MPEIIQIKHRRTAAEARQVFDDTDEIVGMLKNLYDSLPDPMDKYAIGEAVVHIEGLYAYVCEQAAYDEGQKCEK